MGAFRMFVFFLACIGGLVIFIMGLPDLSLADGRSMSPLGILLGGIGITGLAFNYMQLSACLQLCRTPPDADAVEACIDVTAPFLGECEGGRASLITQVTRDSFLEPQTVGAAQPPRL